MEEYKGSISAITSIGLVKKASICYDNQIRRCYCKTNPRYKTYGMRNIKVMYSKRMFISWYLNNYPKHMKKPSVGRIDHNKSYSFNNIKFEELSDNSLERITRCGTTKEKIPIAIYKDNIKILVTKSIKEASKITGVYSGHISKYCRGILNKSKCGYSFKYEKKYKTLNKEYKKKRVLKKIKIYNINNGTIYIANGIKETSLITGIKMPHVMRYCNGILKISKKGYKLELIE